MCYIRMGYNFNIWNYSFLNFEAFHMFHMFYWRNNLFLPVIIYCYQIVQILQLFLIVSS